MEYKEIVIEDYIEEFLTVDINSKEFEQGVFYYYKNKYPECLVSVDVKSKIQNRTRQVDVLVEGTVAGVNIKIVIEVKKHTRPLDVKAVDSFYGFLNDIKASVGVLISASGFSKSAKESAKDRNVQMELYEANDFLPCEPGSFSAYFHFKNNGFVDYLFKLPVNWSTIEEGSLARFKNYMLLPFGIEGTGRKLSQSETIVVTSVQGDFGFPLQYISDIKKKCIANGFTVKDDYLEGNNSMIRKIYNGDILMNAVGYVYGRESIVVLIVPGESEYFPDASIMAISLLRNVLMISNLRFYVTRITERFTRGFLIDKRTGEIVDVKTILHK